MKKTFIIALHLGYWILYLLLILLFFVFMKAGVARNSSAGQQQVFNFIKLISAFTIVPALLSFYTFYALLFNRFLSKKRIAALCLAGLIAVLLAGLAGIAGLGFTNNGMILKYNGMQELAAMWVFMSVLALVHGIIALVMRVFINWYADIKIKEALQLRNFETELALVKSQLSPHFLFNSINNIDVLIEKDPSKASAYLNKLADIMRFMLYETKTENIPLQKELNYIEKYIDLQKIRTTNINFVQYSTEGEPGHWMIAPMLFIPFIENTFKHSGNKKTDQAIVVNIKMAVDKLSFYCENHFNENTTAGYEPGGLGNELIKKRLDLLYPNKHELNIEKKNNIYKVQLIIFHS